MIAAYHAGYILDASIAVKWFAERAEAERDRALAVRARHAAGRIRLSVPMSFLLEVANALRFSHRFADRKSTRLNSSHIQKSRMPSSA